MNLKTRLPFTGTATAALLFCVSVSVNAEMIAANGHTNLTGKFRSLPITVVVTTRKADATAQSNPFPVVSKLDVSVGKSNLWVPPSSYLDLVNPRQATLQVLKDQIILTIAGGDGGDAYMAKIYFDQTRVQRRSLAGASIPRSPTEETRYRQRVLKDE